MKMSETVAEDSTSNGSVKYKIIPVPYYYPVPVDREWYYANKDSLTKQNEKLFGFPEPQLQHFRPSFHHKPPRFHDDFMIPDKYQNGHHRRHESYHHADYYEGPRRSRHDEYRYEEGKRRLSPYSHHESREDRSRQSSPYHHVEYHGDEDLSKEVKEKEDDVMPVVQSVGTLNYIENELNERKIKQESEGEMKSDDVDSSKDSEKNDHDVSISNESNKEDTGKEESSLPRKEENDISSQRKRIRNVIGSLYDKKIKESNGRINENDIEMSEGEKGLDDVLPRVDEEKSNDVTPPPESEKTMESGKYIELGKEWEKSRAVYDDEKPKVFYGEEKPRVIYDDALRPVIPSNIPYVPINGGQREHVGYVPERKPVYDQYTDYPSSSMANANGDCSPDEENKPRNGGRRSRTVFSRRQLVVLNNVFDRNPFVSGLKMSELSDYLGLDRKIVKIWFQNKRQYERKKGSCVDRENETYRGERYVPNTAMASS